MTTKKVFSKLMIIVINLIWILLQKVSLRQIDCIHNPKKIPFSEEEKSFIQEEWEKTIIEKPFLFNGKLFHLQNYIPQDFQITLQMCNSYFKELVGTQCKSLATT